MVNSILINPEDKTITEIDYDGELDTLYNLLDCKTVEAHSFGYNPTILYIDEDARIVGKQKAKFRFKQSYLFRPIIQGKALLVGYIGDNDTEHVDVSYTIEAIKNIVEWIQDK